MKVVVYPDLRNLKNGGEGRNRIGKQLLLTEKCFDKVITLLMMQVVSIIKHFFHSISSYSSS